MKLSEYFISAFMLLSSVMFSIVIAETLDYQSSNTGIELIKTDPPIGPPPPTTGFLKNYTGIIKGTRYIFRLHKRCPAAYTVNQC